MACMLLLLQDCLQSTNLPHISFGQYNLALGVCSRLGTCLLHTLCTHLPICSTRRRAVEILHNKGGLCMLWCDARQTLNTSRQRMACMSLLLQHCHQSTNLAHISFGQCNLVLGARSCLGTCLLHTLCTRLPIFPMHRRAFGRVRRFCGFCRL